MVADLRTDPSRQINAYMNMGSGFGAFAGGMAGDKVRQKKEFEKLYLESANERLISVLSQSSAEGWDKERTHSEIITINKWAQTKAGERYTFNLQRDSMRQKSDSLLEQFDFWNKDLSGALQATSFENAEEDPRVIRARRQLEIATKMFAGEDISGGVPTPIQAPTEGSDKLASQMQGGANNLLGTVGEVATKSISATYGNKVDSEIEAELPATEPYPNPNQSVRSAIDADPERAQNELKLARQALEEGNLPRPKSKAEHDALEPGDKYLDPDGNVRTKK